MDILTLLGAAFVAGLLGSAHCLGMCAGISGLFAVNSSVASLRQQVPLAVTYNLGRVVSYAILGGIVGLSGSVLLQQWPGLAAPVRFISGAIIILVGLKIALNLRLLDVLEKAGATIWTRIAPLAKSVVPVTNVPKAFALGLLWGWLPCGLVYSVLLIAASSANVSHGALTMVAFGLGTLPAMLLTGLGAAQLSRFMRKRSTRVSMGVLIILLGLLTIAMPIQSFMDESSHQHHHASH